MAAKQQIKKRYRLRLNSSDKIEELLQELYDEACKNIEQIQNEMNKLSNSVVLNDEVMEAKTKYAKAMNDFITNKDKAIGRKLDIAKLMTEVFKFNGNVENALNNGEDVGNWQDIIDKLKEEDPDAVEVEEYHIGNKRQ